jgi:predicted nucleotidyltransferase
MPTHTSNFLAIVKALAEQKVDFIVVGGVCAALQGAPVNTFDLDIVHSRARLNLERFLRALGSLDAHFREHKDRKIRPNLSILDTSGHLLLATSEGPLDVLGTIGDDLGYEELLNQTVEMKVSAGLRVRILALDKYVEIKEMLNREKDRAQLPTLRRALEAKQKRSSSSRGQRKKRRKKS